LFRPPVALYAACSGLTGYLLGQGREIAVAAALGIGTLVLAAGASTLNQYQERDLDPLMTRTRNRPLPAGLVSGPETLGLSLLLSISGLALLLFAGRLPALLGVLAVVWYNGVYTPLKRVSAFAAVPGAVVGMVPPVLGWSATGNTLADPGLWALSFLFFLWQVPHFWLQVLHHGGEYEQAGLPSLSSRLGKEQLGRVIFIWICATAASGLLLPLYGAVSSRVFSFLLLPAALFVIAGACPLLSRAPVDRTLAAFRSVNVYILIVMSLLSAERLLLPLH
jgi:protoheme IX farnesyltransferase